MAGLGKPSGLRAGSSKLSALEFSVVDQRHLGLLQDRGGKT
jgi:hypothetical protein